MATATEIAKKALKRLGIVNAGETPSAVDVKDAVDAFADMVSSFESRVLTGDVLPFDSRFDAGLVAMLAESIAEDYSITPGPVLKRDAKDAWRAIKAHYTFVPNSKFDLSLTQNSVNAQQRILSGSVMGDPVWSGLTSFKVRSFVTNNSNRYECVTGGISASSGGPTGTGSEISDGTVVWCWRGVASQ